MDFIFDFGNARVKWFVPHTNAFGDFMHAIKPLTDTEWRQTVGKGKPPKGLIKVNGSPYVVGDAARRYVLQEKPRGAARYREGYYDVALAYALAQGFQRNTRRVNLFASHAPGDIQYVQNLIVTAQKEYQVEAHQGDFFFSIQSVDTSDEPLCGYAHFVFTEKGMERKKNPLANVTTLVIDVGGHTVDVAAVDPGGDIDALSLRSTRVGVIALLENFQSELRAQNATRFQDAGDLDIRRVEAAIINGYYQFGRLQIPCADIAQAGINSLVNDVIQVINEAGGAANYDTMLLTGGGAALIYNTLVENFPHVDFLLAEPNMDDMKYANVFGGAKLAALLRQVS